MSSLILSEFKKGLQTEFRKIAEQEAYKLGRGNALKENTAETAQSYARGVGKVLALEDAQKIIDDFFKNFNKEE